MYLSEGGAFGSLPDGYLEYRASKAVSFAILPWEWENMDNFEMERILAFSSAEDEAAAIMQKRAARKNRR